MSWQAWTQAYIEGVLASPRQMVAFGFALFGVVFAAAAATVRVMVPLRWLAAASTACLLVFGVLRPSPTTAAVALLLLPINIWRVFEIMRLARSVRRATAGSDQATLWLRPYMKPRRLRAGAVLFRKGEPANRLYLLTEGELEVAEIGERIVPGRIFGEIALFSPAHVRTGTVRALTDCTVLWIHESTVQQLYHQNPSFGFHLIGLLASRLSTDVQRGEQRLAEALQQRADGGA